MLPFKLVYDDRYDLNLGAHVFPSQKYRLVHDKLLADGIAAPDDFLAPSPASDADVLRVHSQDYVYKLKNGSLTPTEILRMEVPYSKELVNACWLAAAGSSALSVLQPPSINIELTPYAPPPGSNVISQVFDKPSHSYPRLSPYPVVFPAWQKIANSLK